MLGQEAAEAPPHEIDAAAQYALDRLAQWIGAANAYWVGAVRDEIPAQGDPMLGWKPRDVLFARDHQALVAHSAAIASRIEQGAVDLSTVGNVQRAGTTRCFLREELVSDGLWERSWILNQYHRPRGIEDQLVGAHALDSRHESYVGLVRTRTDRRFTSRQRELLLFFLQASRALHTRLMFARGLIAGERLTPREREVLQALTTDASEKEIAHRLGLSEATVHQHARAVYAKHRVRGRLGLLAAAITRQSADGTRSRFRV